MGRQHRLLDCVVGVFVGQAALPGRTVQPGPVAAEQFLESAAITGGVRAEQIGIAESGGRKAGHVRGR